MSAESKVYCSTVGTKADRMVALKDEQMVEHWVDMMAVTKVD